MKRKVIDDLAAEYKRNSATKRGSDEEECVGRCVDYQEDLVK